MNKRMVPMVAAPILLLLLVLLLWTSSLAVSEPGEQTAATAMRLTVDAEVQRRLEATAIEQTVSAQLERAVQATREIQAIASTRTAIYGIEFARATSSAMATQSAEQEAIFLAENAQRPEVNTTTSGLQYQVVMPGSGRSVLPDDMVIFSYRFSLPSGEVLFDLNTRPNAAITGHMSALFEGLREGILLMQEGATYRFWIPSHLAFGPYWSGPQGLPPFSTFVVDVTLAERRPEAIADERNRWLVPGSNVEMTADQVRVRARPSLDAELVGYLPLGQNGLIVMGPVQENGMPWWNVWFPDGAGWVVADYLQPH